MTAEFELGPRSRLSLIGTGSSTPSIGVLAT
jgi:hypothetical protein